MAAIKSELWLEGIVFVLALSLWFATAPVSLSRDFSPAEQIENALPAKQTMQSASKPDFLAAVCGAVRKNRKAGAGITAAAIAARGEMAGEIVGTVLRCARKIDCQYVGAIVGAAVTAQPKSGTAISDAAMARAPNCSETIQKSVRAAVESEPGPAASANALSAPRPGPDEGFDPREPLVLVCADGVQRAIRTSQVEEFIRANPGSVLGSCPPPTPTPTHSPASAPSAAAAPSDAASASAPVPAAAPTASP